MKLNKSFNFLLAFLFAMSCIAQEDEKSFGNQIFLPSIDVGYVENSSDFLSGGVIVKTSIEFRLRNNNDLFFRLNYDTYDAEYRIDNFSSSANVIKGKTNFTDMLAGPGYRFGDNKYRAFIMMQAGSRAYNYPVASLTNNSIISIEQANDYIFSSRLTLGFEYYFDEKSAFSFDVFQNQVWKDADFWQDNRVAYGFSVGIITSLF